MDGRAKALLRASTLTRASIAFGAGALVTALGVVPSVLQSQQTGKAHGGFILRLGRDTVALERYERRADRLTGEMALRVPTTTYIRYQTDLRPDGTARRSVAKIEALGSRTAVHRSVTIDFAADSMRVTTDSASLHRVEMRHVAPGAIPLIAGPYGTSYATYEWLISRVRDGDSVTIATVSPVNARQGSAMFVRRSPTRADIDFFTESLMPVTLDGDGHVLAVDANLTTVRVNARRVDAINVASLARRFGAQDREGKSLGVASPADSVHAVVHGVQLAIHYSSPRMRGRKILGDLLPYGAIWRTGANAATLLDLDGDLAIGGRTVPAGHYSLWTVPTGDGAELIVNRQHGQWGTEHDSTKDMLRIPLKVAQTTSPQEAFVIEVTPEFDLRFRWSTFIWSAPLVRP